MNLLKMTIIVLALGLFSFAANASESYECVGKDLDGKAAQITITFESNSKATLVDMDDTDVDLVLAKQTSDATVFGNYEWDGYGGFFELLLPGNFSISGSGAVEEFETQLKHDLYSEIGLVGSFGFKGKCERTDN